MPDANSIPFRQASGNGHYESKQLPNDNADFLTILGLPTSVGNVTSASPSSLDGQLAAYWGISGSVIKASTAIGLVNLVDGVVTTKITPAGEIVGTTAVQTLTNKTITGAVLTAPTGLTKADVGLGAVDNTPDSAKPVSAPQQTALNLKEDKSAKAVANGYASLDAGGKVPAAQLPTTVQGTVTHQGTWNATSNTPVIPAASAANKGWYYVVSVAGTVSVSGVSDWGVGDWLVSNGTTWDKIDNTDAVASVAGKTGVVTLTKVDVGLNNVDNTSDDTKNSAAATLTNKTISGTSNTLTVRLDADVANNLPVNRLNNGIGATDQTWWCGDGQWKSPSGAGDVVGPAGAGNDEVALFSGATGKLLKRATGSGIVTVVNGVWQAPNSDIGSIFPVGGVVQTVVQEFNAWLGSATIMPTDTTIPQIGEGVEMFTMTFTPKYATSRIYLTFQGTWFCGGAIYSACALFKNAVANALASDLSWTGANQYGKYTFAHYEPAPGSTSTITFRVRFGPGSAGTIFTNGNGSAQNLGGTQKCVLTAMEIKQ